MPFLRLINKTGWPKNLEFDNLGKKKPGKTWNFEQKSLKSWKNLGFLAIITC